MRGSWLLVAACVLAAAACDRPSNDVSAASSPPPMKTPVGPVPGPVEQPSRPNNPYNGDRTAAGEGRQLFVRFNCSGCHGGRAGGGMGPSLRDVDWMYGATDAQVFSSIAEGRAHGMPAWGTKLNDDQIWKLVAYIKTLRTQNEIQPPS
ncbi:MAG TPA: c-type cytochrome [Vicinamibacterales bacterium]|nr:c-type cytochrome [Vicinamibacterales bacterium]